MDLVSGIAVYFMIWWVVLFMVLPWGYRPIENPELGHATSAPAKPHLKLKFLVTSGISAIIWLVVYLLVTHDVIDFRSIAAAMMQEDSAK